MIDFRKPLVTVNGNFPVRVICTDRKCVWKRTRSSGLVLNKIIYLFEQNGVEHIGICDIHGYVDNSKVIKNPGVKKWRWAMKSPAPDEITTYVTKHLSRDEVNLLKGVIIGRVEGTEIEE